MRIGGVSGASPVAAGGGAHAAGGASAPTAPRTDTCSFSPLQQMRSQRANKAAQVESLTKQKDSIKEQAAKSGQDMSDRLKKLDEKIQKMNEEIQKLDQKIVKQAAKEAKAEQAAQSRRAATEKPVTEEEAAAKQAGELTDLLSGINSAQQLSSVKDRLDRRTRVLESEVKLDASTGGASERKISELTELKMRSSSLGNEISARILEINDKTAQTAEKAAEQKKDDEESSPAEADEE